MSGLRLGLAMTGSFCTFDKALAAAETLAERYELVPIMSETAWATDTRFGPAAFFRGELARICGREVIHTIPGAEPIGPRGIIDLLLIMPCTGNTLAKLAGGITDSCVTMAAKAQLRNGRPVVLAVSTNDGLAASAKNIGLLLERKNVYFVPFTQDDPRQKPTSLAADLSQACDTLEAARRGEQLQPVLV